MRHIWSEKYESRKADPLLQYFSSKKKLFNRKPDYTIFIELPSLSHSRNHYIFKFSLPENSWLLSISMPISYFPVLKRAHISHHAKTPTQLSKCTSKKLLYLLERIFRINEHPLGTTQNRVFPTSQNY